MSDSHEEKRLFRRLATRLEENVRGWNAAHASEPGFQLLKKEHPDPDHITFVGKTYKKVRRNEGFDDVLDDLYLEISFSEAPAAVEYCKIPGNGQRSLPIKLSGGEPAFFEGEREISLERASGVILEEFLDDQRITFDQLK